jgi:sugar lactone lactonase YvrE
MTIKRVSNITSSSRLTNCAFVLASVITASCGGGNSIPLASKFNVGGSVTGLAGAGLVLANNGTDTVAVSADGSFKFGTQMQSGQNYAVTVKAEPANPTQACVVTNGAGTMASSDITNVGVTCTTKTFPIGAAVNGLAGSGLVLQNNSADDLAVAASGQVQFSSTVASGDPYNVTVKTQPSNPAQSCSVSGGSGTVTSGPVTSVVVGCDTLSLSVLAGHLGGFGNIDGSGTGARLNQPSGSGIDASGNVYIADSFNHTVRKITPAGVVTTFAGMAGVSGSADGTGKSASFYFPSDVAIDASGNLYVSDSGNHTIRKITAAGAVTTLAGLAGSPGSADGTGTAARFNRPLGLVADASGNVYVADSLNNTIRMISSAGTVTTLAGVPGMNGSADGPAATATFFQPGSVAVDASGNVFVADTGSSTVRRIAAGTVTTLAGTPGVSGAADGTGANASFLQPSGIATDAAGTLYVADTGNSTVRRVTPAGVVTTLAGTAGVLGSANGTGAAAQFSGPHDLSVDASGTVFVADSGNNMMRKLTAAGVVTSFAGAAPVRGSSDQTGAAASFSSPLGIATDAAGNTYVADYQNQTIRKVSPSGVVSTLAGSPGIGGSVDGTGSAARFNYPYAVAVDSAGTIYVADALNYLIRAVTPAGVVTTLAGSAGMSGSVDGTGAAARFGSPAALAVDTNGNVYVADGSTIRRVTTPSGVVTTLAGMAGSPDSIDGTGAAARFYSPQGVAIDSSGNILVADFGAGTIRKVTAAGVVTTLAGTPYKYGSADGTGAAASFLGPEGIAVDVAGNAYVADSGNHTIRKMGPTGVVTTVVGVAGAQGVAPGPLPASLNDPWGVAVLPGSQVSLVISSTAENAILRADLP